MPGIVISSSQLLQLFVKYTLLITYGLVGFVHVVFSQENNPSPASAIVKGKLLAYHNQTKAKLPISLAVRNMRTQEREWRVFSPDTVNGEFFMFLLPDDRYEINVHAEGFKPYTIVLFVPNHTFLYEINRSVYFEPIYLLDTHIGQQAVVKEDSQQIYMTYDSVDFENYQEAKYKTLQELVNYTMTKGNPAALDSLSKITVNEAAAAMPEEYILTQRAPNDTYKALFDKLREAYENDSWEYVDKEYAKQNVGRTYFEMREKDTQLQSKKQKVIVSHSVWFDGQNEKRLTKEQKARLDELANFINKDERLVIEILGKTQPKATQNPQQRLKLSQKRTKQVFRYLKKRIDDPTKFHYIVYGLSEQLEEGVTNSSTKPDEALLLTNTPRVELLICME